MKLLISNFLIIAASLVSGIIISEASYFFLIIIKYLAYGQVIIEHSGFFRGIKVGGVGGGILGIGIVLFRFFKVKGF